MNVIVTGSLGYDYIMDFPGRFADRIMPDKIHKISLSFLVDKFSKQFGGTACNVAYTLKLLGVTPLVLSAAGSDFAPYKSFLREKKITTRYIEVFSDVATGSYHVTTDREDNQIGAFYRGPMKYNSRLSIGGIKEKVDFVVIGPHDPGAMLKHARECRELDLPYLFDPAFQIDSFNKEDLSSTIATAAILIGNDYEIALIENKLQLTHKELLKKAKIVITTLGSKGSAVETRGKNIKVKAAKPKNISDPTGAGDAYRAGFLAGYLRGLDLKTCGQMGSLAAVYSVEKYGTQTHEFTIEQFSHRYKDNFREILSL